jgi:hypothetical protein
MPLAYTFGGGGGTDIFLKNCKKGGVLRLTGLYMFFVLPGELGQQAARVLENRSRPTAFVQFSSAAFGRRSMPRIALLPAPNVIYSRNVMRNKP